MPAHRVRVATLACFVGLITGVASAQTPIRELVPADAVAFVEWSNLPAMLGLEAIQPDPTKALIHLLGEGMSAEDRHQADALVDLALAAANGRGVVAVFAEKPTDGSDIPFSVAAVVDLGQRRAVVEAAINRLDGPDAAASRRTIEIGGIKLQADKSGGESPSPIWGFHNDTFLFAMNRAAAERMAKRLAGQGESISANAQFKEAHARVGELPGGWGFAAFFDVATLWQRIGKPMIESAGSDDMPAGKIATATGIDGLRSVYTRLGPSGATSRMRTFIGFAGPKKGLLKLWDQTPLTEADLALIPQDAYWGGATKLNLAEFWNELEERVEDISDDLRPQIEGATTMAAMYLGFSLNRDLLPNLGDTWAYFDAPGHGGIYGTGTVLVNNVRNAEAVHGMLSNAVQRLSTTIAQLTAEHTKQMEASGGALPPNVKLVMKQAKRGAYTAHYVVIQGLPSPVSPSWGVVDGRVVFGLLPQPVLLAMQQVDSKARKSSVLDREDVRAALKEMPKGLHTFGCADNHYMLHMIYPLLTHFAAAFTSMQPDAAKIDMLALPHFSEFLKTPKFGVAGGGPVEGGTLYESIGPSIANMSVAGTAMGVSILLPSLSRSRELARRTVCASNLRGVGMGLMIYATDHKEKLPKDLGELIKLGLLSPDQLVCPGGLAPEHGVAAALESGGLAALGLHYIDGQTMSSDPRNVFVYEDLSHHQEGANVLFMDGHVEFVKPPRYFEVIRETYKRLGREKDMPAEFRDTAAPEK